MQSGIPGDTENLDPQHFPNNNSDSTNINNNNNTNNRSIKSPNSSCGSSSTATTASLTNNSNNNSKFSSIENRTPQNFSFSSTFTAGRNNWLPSELLQKQQQQHHQYQHHHHPYNQQYQYLNQRNEGVSPLRNAFTLLSDEEARFGGFSGKPNAIVRPIRRSATTDQQQADNDQPASSAINANVNENAASNGGASGVRGAAARPAPVAPPEESQRRRYFADELNRKLRFLRGRGAGAGGGDVGGGGAATGIAGGTTSGEGMWTKSLDGTTRRESPTKFSFSGNYNSQFREPNFDVGGGGGGGGIPGNAATEGAEGQRRRPLFVTTVPTGVFLPPPSENEMPLQAFLAHRIYAFSSHPVVYGYDGPTTDNYYYNTNYNYNNPTGNQTGSSSDYAGSSPYGGSTQRKSMPSSKEYSNFHATATIPSSLKKFDEDFTVVNSLNPSNVARSRAQPITATATGTGASAGVAGGLHVTKEQFQQQIQQRRGKSKETPPQQEPYRNVMCDRRVARGSNFVNAQLLCDSDPFDKAAELRRHHAIRKKAQCRNQRNVLGTPPPVNGRRHEVIQTEKYLEELVQRPPEYSVDTQTDLFLERPPTPPYIPAKVGVDVGTEIGEGELFHFDAEAQPIIDVLVDSCIEQSMLEVAHEQEIAELRRKQDEFLALREAELAALRRLEAEDVRLMAEKERRERQEAIAAELDAEMQKGVTAAKLLQGHIASLVPEVLENLEPATDAVKKEQLMKTICPWLAVEVAEEVGHIVDSREILTVIIQEIIKQRAEIYAGYKDAVAEETKKPITEQGEGEEDGEGEGLGDILQDMDCIACDSSSTSVDSKGCPVIKDT